MAFHNDLGKIGENLAAEYLRNNGYEILSRNFVFQKAEIDIIAKIGCMLAIVEVKTRSSTEFGLPQDFVSPAKIQLLVKAVNEFVIQQDLDLEVRFDIIAIHKQGHDFVVEHLENAFYHF